MHSRSGYYRTPLNSLALDLAISAGDLVKDWHEDRLHFLKVLRHREMTETIHRNELGALDIRRQLFALFDSRPRIVFTVHDVHRAAVRIYQMRGGIQIMLDVA